MSIIIDNSSKKITSQKKQYGKLTVETSIKPENNIAIGLGINNHSNLLNVESPNNMQPRINPEPKINAYPRINMDKRKLVDTSKSIKLGKGQKISLNESVKNLSKLLVTLDFNINSKSNNEFELDTSVFMVDKNNKTIEKDFIFYENTKSSCGGIVIDEDHNTFLKEAYNQSIQLDLNAIPAHIEKLAFTLTIYEANERFQNFGQVSQGYFRIIAADTKQEILNYKFDDNLSMETAMVVVEIYRYKSQWKINCIGSGFRGGLEALCSNYGIETI